MRVRLALMNSRLCTPIGPSLLLPISITSRAGLLLVTCLDICECWSPKSSTHPLGELRRGDSLAPRQTSRLAFCFPFYAYGYGNSGLRAAAKKYLQVWPWVSLALYCYRPLRSECDRDGEACVIRAGVSFSSHAENVFFASDVLYM